MTLQSVKTTYIERRSLDCENVWEVRAVIDCGFRIYSEKNDHSRLGGTNSATGTHKPPDKSPNDHF